MLSLKIYTAMLVIIFGGIVLFFKVVNTKTTLIKPPYKASHLASLFVPQSWAFFTRNPKLNNLEVFRYVSGSVEKVDIIGMRNHSTLNLSRYSRIVAREAGRLQELSAKLEWNDCHSDPRECAKDTTFFPLDNPKNKPYFCGKFLLVLRDRLPWPWRKSKTQLPSKALNIEVSCEGER